jgi:hypothetical protein
LLPKNLKKILIFFLKVLTGRIRRVIMDITIKGGMRMKNTPETGVMATDEIPGVFYVKVGTQDVEVIKNPTDSEYQQLSKEFRKEYPRAPKDEIQIRTTYDEKGNKYIWRADNATHDTIEKHLQTVYGVKSSQNKRSQ